MKDELLSLLRNVSIQKSAIAVFWLLILCASILTICKHEINADSCFYIAVSRLLNDGLVLFVDFNPGYTPLSFYIMQLPQLVVGQNFTALLTILYAIQFVNSYILYKICYKETGSSNLSNFAAILFMMVSLMWCPEYILEPFILFFGLLSVFCWYRKGKKYLVLCGFLCFCSFWSKQYGLGFLCLALAYALIKGNFSRLSFRDAGIIFLGFLIGTFVFVSLLILQGIDLSSMAKLNGGSYEKDGIQGLIEGYILLLKMLPLLLLPTLLVLLKIRQSVKTPIIIVSVCGILGFMLQCYVRLYGHYLQLAIPFCAMLFVAIPKIINKKDYRTYYKFALIFVLLFPLRFFIPSCFALLQSTEKQNQINCAAQVTNFIPDGTDGVFASQDMLYVTLLNSYNPPMLLKYGLSNGFVRKPEEIMDLCQNASYCIIGVKEANNKSRFTPKVITYLETFFDKHPFYGIDGKIAGNVLVRK